MKLFNKKIENQLDEMQEQKLLKIESTGFKIAFWGSFFLYLGQELAGCEFKQYAGELLLFMVICIYTLIFSMKNSIWDRHLKPNNITNLIISAICSAIGGLVFGLKVYFEYPGKPIGSIAAGIFITGFMFVLIFGLLTIQLKIYKKKKEQEEAAMNEDEK